MRPSALRARAAAGLFLLLPFVVLGAYLSVPGGTSIGNDYIRYSIRNQQTLFFSISQGSFPLFVPGYWHGQSASALTLGQLYHPMAWVAYALPGYWQGAALLIGTWLRLLSLGAAQLALHRLFHRLGAPTCWAFVCSFVAVYNLRMLDLFRYGAPLESYTGFLFACAALGFLWLEPGRRRRLVLLVGSLYWLISSGHPQMAYYGALGVLLFAGLCPFLCAAMLGQPRPASRALAGYYARALGGLAAAAALSAAYLIPFYADFLSTNCGRVGQDYRWAAAHTDSVRGAMESFVAPLRGDVHGSFGGSALIAMAPVLPVLLLAVVPGPRVLWVLWGAGAVVFLHLLGPGTPVHHLFWRFLPFAGSIRVAGRLSLLLPLLIALMLLLVWRRYPGRLVSRLFMLVIVLYAVGACLAGFAAPSRGAPLVLRPEAAGGVEVLTQLLALGSLIAVAAWAARPGARIRGRLAAAAVVLQVTAVLSFGTWITPAPPTPTLAELKDQVRTRLAFQGRREASMGRMEVCSYERELRARHFSEAVARRYLEPPLAAVETRFELIDGREAFFEKLARHTDPVLQIEAPPAPPADRDAAPGAASVALAYSSFNRLVFRVKTDRMAYAVVGYPFTSHWEARVNGAPTPTVRANGLHLAVSVPPGDTVLDLRYWSRAQLGGMVVSCLALAALWVAASCAWLKGSKRYLSSAMGVLIAAALLSVWGASLYTGASLETRYEWTTGTLP